ncbi:MAG: type I methionyl aminopeptidase [Proteobacteria bacterium]|nr:type I methionyl aminopeptidase [Pseudomonadota bacterium]MBU1738301.1 type I methionyl aminopeptidase [Pseudomonadota bacterium]
MSRSITLKSPSEIQIMREANQIVAETLAMLESRIEPGLNTLRLDIWAEEFARKKGGEPAFKGYRGFPGSLCVSLNEEVVHGIPSERVILKEGDILSIDFGVKFRGFYGDAAITVPVGNVSPLKEELIRVTRVALEKAVSQVRVGNRVNDISAAVEQYVETANNFSVVRQFVGHGIGSQLHEPPEIPNYSRKGQTPRLLPGMVLAIEPMVNAGKYEVKVLKDGWTVVTADREPSAHFEHTVVVTEDGPLILTERAT